MCGIVCFLGNGDSTKMVLEGLMLLQNRGYDSVGISSIKNNQLQTIKFASTNTYNSIDLLHLCTFKMPIIYDYSAFSGIIKI